MPLLHSNHFTRPSYGIFEHLLPLLKLPSCEEAGLGLAEGRGGAARHIQRLDQKTAISRSPKSQHALLAKLPSQSLPTTTLTSLGSLGRSRTQPDGSQGA